MVVDILPKKYQLPFANTDAMFVAIAGYGLGSLFIALPGRVAGGIYRKTADVGADLSGKNKYGLEAYGKRNPVCVTDNVELSSSVRSLRPHAQRGFYLSPQIVENLFGKHRCVRF